MVTISVKSDLDKFATSLSDMARGQLRFATAKALTATAKAAQAAVTAAMPETFDRPTPFTQRGIGITPATKATLTAVVFVKDAQASYLRVQETGGKQVRHGKAVLEPKHVKLNKYGNLPKGKLKALLAEPDVFAGRVRFADGKMVAGIWRRPKRGRRQDAQGKAPGKLAGLELLIRFADGVDVTPRFRFADQVRKVAASTFPTELSAALEIALRTAR